MKIKQNSIEVRIDNWNHNKIWFCKRSKCGHYYIAEKVGNNYFKYARVRKAHYMEIINNSVAGDKTN